MHEALCRPSGTTLDTVHAERRAADHSTNSRVSPRHLTCFRHRPRFLLETHDLARRAVADGSGSHLLRHHRKGLIVGRQIALGHPAVGRRHYSDAGQGQLLAHAALEAFESARSERPRASGE